MPDQQGYLSTDPQAGTPLAGSPPPAAAAPAAKPSSSDLYLSMDPHAGTPLAASPPPAVAPAGRGPGATGAGAGRGGGRGGGAGSVGAANPQAPSTAATEFYPGGWKAGAQDLAGIVGGIGATAAAGALLPEAAGVAGVATTGKLLSYGSRLLRGAAGIAGAGAAGGATALATGSPASGPGEDTAVAAATRQAQMEAMGLGTGWAISGAVRRAVGSRVGRAAAEWLANTRDAHVADLQRILNNTQDAIQAHQATSAAAGVAKAGRSAHLGGEIQQGLAQARGAKAAGDAAQAAGDARTAEIRTTATGDITAATTAAQAAGDRATTIRAQADAQSAALGQQSATALGEARAVRGAAKGAQAAGDARTEGLKGQWPAATPPPQGTSLSPAAQATSKVAQVVAGPAQSSLDKLGQAVESAAETGPRVKWAPIKDRLDAMVAKTQPDALTPVGEPAPLTPNEQGTLALAQTGQRTPITEADYRTAIGKDVPLEEGHPLPGVLGKLQSVEGDSVSFSDAHKFKRLLDDAINWAPPGAVRTPARPQLKAITKGIRGQLRDAMAGHAPYDQATAAYADASTLFGPQGLARKIQASARSNPDMLLQGIKGSEPTKIQMLKEVLLGHAEAGGGAEGAAQGQEAWDAVRGAWTHEHLIKPGIDKFDASLAKLHPEAVHALYGDPAGQQVLGNLRQMSEAVKQSMAQTAQEVAGHEATRTAALATHQTAVTAKAAIPPPRNAAVGAAKAEQRGFSAAARTAKASRVTDVAASNAQTATEVGAHDAVRAGATARVQGLRATQSSEALTNAQVAAQHTVAGNQLQVNRVEAGRDLAEARLKTPAERAFNQSSLANQPPPGAMASDAVYAAAAPPGSPRQVAGATRFFLKGPKVNDLIQWASLSPTWTQMVVRAFTSPLPGQAVAAALRYMDWSNGATEPKMQAAHQQQARQPAATPPPAPVRAASPPPGPGR